LISFDLKEVSGARLVKHLWGYDALGRKDAAADIEVSSAYFTADTIDIAYDSASRLTSEQLSGGTGAWGPNVYTFDPAGNRATARLNGGTTHNYYHGAGNRETEGWPDPLEYDYKGNVATRPLVESTGSVSYTWDAYDRMVTATRTGQTAAGYDYDALGRLLRRRQGTEKRLMYWLGLNRIAEETSLAGRDRRVSGWTGFTGFTGFTR
jgi:uncharacterized protein RhaS with RHS repeats